MISRVKGLIIEVDNERVVVDVGGIGYEILVPQPLFETLRKDEQTELLTYHLVRENTQELFGFAEVEAKRLFEQLIGVSGIGPKSALAIMSLGNQDKLRSAIAGEDVAFIAAASGVGKKSAERVVVELKDKVGSFVEQGKIAIGDDAAVALMALGYSQAQAAQALRGIDTDSSTQVRVKEALKKLS